MLVVSYALSHSFDKFVHGQLFFNFGYQLLYCLSPDRYILHHIIEFHVTITNSCMEEHVNLRF